jgi:hypothetical protein
MAARKGLIEGVATIERILIMAITTNNSSRVTP